jgi:hypothetical protein
MNKYLQIKREQVHNFRGGISYYRKSRQFRELLDKNREFKNIHQGKRCFILGNGPSLKEENLSVLGSEYVFTVNQITRNNQFEYIKPTYHFWADPNFFKIDESKPEDIELLKVMININTDDNHPICFFPIDQFDFIKKFGIDNKIEVRYFFSAYTLYDGYKKDIDYTKAVPGFDTVVLWCITMAIYMGFSEIYLLGCDNTGLINTIQSVANSSLEFEYSYEVTENEKKRLQNLQTYHSLEEYVQAYLNTLKEYRAMYNYCCGRGIKLVNCSSTSAIDSIPRESLQEVLS